jgi:predicted glycoside hydrolase/deacetylase ChbG (UPF0249 family)
MTHSTSSLQDVRLELSAQIERAIASGIDVTHIDSHIFALRHPLYVDIFLGLGRKYRIPCLVVRRRDPEIEALGLPAADVAQYYATVDAAEREGLAVFTACSYLPLGEPNHRLEQARRTLDLLPEGLSALLFHPAVDTPQLRRIAHDWPARVADYDLLRSDSWLRALESSGVRVVGMRAVRAAQRASAGAA